MQLTNHPETRGKSESPIGVTDAKNLKNLGMYGLLIGTFEARHKTQATGSKLTFNSLFISVSVNLLSLGSAFGGRLIVKTGLFTG